MNVREATADDSQQIRSVARDSVTDSYSHFLNEKAIETALEQWYGEDIDERLTDENALFLVVEDDDEIVAFSQSELVGDTEGVGRILWLHVEPSQRGSGIGTRLLVRTRKGLLEAGCDQIQAAVLAGNEVGSEFYAGHGFTRAAEREIDIGDDTLTEHVYVESERETGDDWRALEEVMENGDTLYVSYGEPVRGSVAPFYTTYLNADASRRYGWFYGNCNSLDNAMDAMGRIVCNECDNKRKATRWDAAYL